MANDSTSRRLQLVHCFGSLEEAERLASTNPQYTHQLKVLHVRMHSMGDPVRAREAYWDLVWEATIGQPEPSSDRAHPGGAKWKLWPRLAIEEATRLWETNAYDRSQNEIAKQVTKTVIAKWDPADLEQHGWDKKPFKFGRTAILVVAAIDAGLLEWDSVKGLGVFRKFSATTEWLVIPRPERAS